MELEKQVCSLELAKKLKELGVKQESFFYWWESGWEAKWNVIEARNFMCDCDSEPEAMHGCDIREIAAERIGGPGKYDPKAAYSAFTVAELGEMLPEGIKIDGGFLFIDCPHHNSPMGYRCWISNTNGTAPCAVQPKDNKPRLKTEADARAKMLIYLIEKKLIAA